MKRNYTIKHDLVQNQSFGHHPHFTQKMFERKGDAWNDFVMNRNGQVQTVSVTSLEVDNNQFGKIYHEDLQK